MWAQHGVVARRQLLGLGFSPKAIAHRVGRGRLRPVLRGVYALGGAELTREGRWMAAVLACGEGAFLTHSSAGALYGICEERRIEVGVRGRRHSRREVPRLRERLSLPGRDVGSLHRIPVTAPVRTLVDLATILGPRHLLRAVNEADKREVVRAFDLRRQLEDYSGQPGVRALRKILDEDTFVLSDDELERRFLPLAREVGLPLPLTREIVNGFEVDFLWPGLKLVIETDGLRYHRTASAQARDLERDQAHTAAGFTRLRFSHRQVKHEPARVRRILAATAARLTGRG